MDNSSKTEKYPDIEYVLHIYDTIWDYYKKSLDERTQLFNNYIVFVGIPISAVGIIAERLRKYRQFYSGNYRDPDSDPADRDCDLSHVYQRECGFEKISYADRSYHGFPDREI